MKKILLGLTMVVAIFGMSCSLAMAVKSGYYSTFTPKAGKTALITKANLPATYIEIRNNSSNVIFAKVLVGENNEVVVNDLVYQSDHDFLMQDNYWGLTHVQISDSKNGRAAFDLLACPRAVITINNFNNYIYECY